MQFHDQCRQHNYVPYYESECEVEDIKTKVSKLVSNLVFYSESTRYWDEYRNIWVIFIFTCANQGGMCETGRNANQGGVGDRTKELWVNQRCMSKQWRYERTKEVWANRDGMSKPDRYEWTRDVWASEPGRYEWTRTVGASQEGMSGPGRHEWTSEVWANQGGMNEPGKCEPANQGGMSEPGMYERTRQVWANQGSVGERTKGGWWGVVVVVMNDPGRYEWTRGRY